MVRLDSAGWRPSSFLSHPLPFPFSFSRPSLSVCVCVCVCVFHSSQFEPGIMMRCCRIGIFPPHQGHPIPSPNPSLDYKLIFDDPSAPINLIRKNMDGPPSRRSTDHFLCFRVWFSVGPSGNGMENATSIGKSHRIPMK